jgi:hypothetical protein
MSRIPKATTQTASTETGEPVPGFPLSFTWSTGDWQRIFDRQIELVKQDVARARAEDRLVFYLSCPISSRGGGSSATNVNIARHVERSILERWGEAFWVLNPAQYQLESKAGTGLINAHAKESHIDLPKLRKKGGPLGGDYMRMWTKVLVEDGEHNEGRHFDAFYFLGPSDVASFFSQGESPTITARTEAYFARKAATDAAFRDEFAVSKIDWGVPPKKKSEADAREVWSKRRKDFLRYYALLASANFSLGSHDEWAIFRLINATRRKHSATADMLDGDVGDQVAAFFDGRQVDLSASEGIISRGYAVK